VCVIRQVHKITPAQHETTFTMDSSDHNTNSNQLNGIESIRQYIDRLITGDGRCQGMKVLLLDASTTQILSCVSSQSEILSREVYLVSRLDDTTSSNTNKNGGSLMSSDINSLELTEENNPDNNQVSHMKAVCYLRPTQINIGLLVKELASPRFSEYHIYFSGILPMTLLTLLAESD